MTAQANIVSNLFNFADLSDLPENLRKPLETKTRDNANAYAQIVKDAADAGFPSLTIREIAVVAFRKFGSVPALPTIRNYLNSAIDLKLIGKPTRSSYGADASVVVAGDDEDEVADVADVAEAAAPAEEAPAADPLASLGV